MAGLFTASYRDCIPKGREGLFQGCRMVLYVLVPMIIGPLIAQFIINQYNKGVTDSADIVYPMELFLGAAAVMVFCFIPASVVRKKQDAVHEKLLEEMKRGTGAIVCKINADKPSPRRGLIRCFCGGGIHRFVIKLCLDFRSLCPV